MLYGYSCFILVIVADRVDISPLKENIKRLENEQNDIKSQIKQHEHEMVRTSALESKILEIEQNILKKVESMIQTRDENQLLRNETEKVRKTCHDLEILNNKLSNQCQELESMNIKLSHQCTETENMNKQLTAQSIALEEENQDFKVNIFDLENQLKGRFKSVSQIRDFDIPTVNRIAVLEPNNTTYTSEEREDKISQEKEMIEANEHLKLEFENGNDPDTTYTPDTKTLK